MFRLNCMTCMHVSDNHKITEYSFDIEETDNLHEILLENIKYPKRMTVITTMIV